MSSIASYSSLVSRATELDYDATLIYDITNKVKGEGSEGAIAVATAVKSRFAFPDTEIKRRVLQLVDALVIECGPEVHRALISVGFLVALTTNRDKKISESIPEYWQKWKAEMGQEYNIAFDQAFPSTAVPSPTSVTHQYSSRPVGQFKIRPLNALVPFLTMPFMRVQRILFLARDSRIFHMQSIHIARQVLHLVILLNDSVDTEEGPNDEQEDERIDLEDELIGLENAMKEWGAETGIHEDYNGRVPMIQEQYARFFRRRFYFYNARDPQRDRICKKLLEYDKKSIAFKHWQENYGENSMDVYIEDLDEEKEAKVHAYVGSVGANRATSQTSILWDKGKEVVGGVVPLSQANTSLAPGAVSTDMVEDQETVSTDMEEDQEVTKGGEVLSWTSSDPRGSVLFGPDFKVYYRFVTEVDNRGVTTTTMWRTDRQSQEDKLAKFEWTSNGSLGRATIGRTTCAVSELLRPVHGDLHSSTRFFSGPDGRLYTWASSATGECILYDANEKKVAFFRPVRPTRCDLGDVYGELHFYHGQTTGTLMHPPLMDMICMTGMAYRVLIQWGS